MRRRVWTEFLVLRQAQDEDFYCNRLISPHGEPIEPRGRTLERRGVLAVLGIGLLAACKRPSDPPAAPPSAEGQAALKKAAAEPGAKTLPSGLIYKVVRSGPPDGPHPAKGDTIKINYAGSLTDGTVFDSTDKEGVPAVMPLNHLVPGWMEALPLMRPGDVWLITLPPKLGYGDKGAGGGVIPPGAVLTFRIELLGVLPKSGGTGLA